MEGSDRCSNPIGCMLPWGHTGYPTTCTGSVPLQASPKCNRRSTVFRAVVLIAAPDELDGGPDEGAVAVEVKKALGALPQRRICVSSVAVWDTEAEVGA